MTNCEASHQSSRLETHDLPPTLLCKRTGLAAGTEECTCDACLWVAALEADFLENQEEDCDGS